ncbi:YecA family protein [Bradyrhizobium uaiense]|nr:YecA family protein [Bradyrhizobium uaiense]
MLDGYVAAIVVGPVSMSPPDWICPLLAIDTRCDPMVAQPVSTE